MKKLFIFLFFLLGTITLSAQEKEESSNILADDPLDLSAELKKIEELGVPTLALVDEMKVKADNLFENQQWEEAAAAYEEYAKKANWLANILSTYLEPYYSASYKKRDAISLKRLNQISPFERKANQYKEERNIAYVKMGICKKNLGDTKTAAALLLRALNIIDISQTEYWDMATEALSEIIGYTQ